MDQNMKLYYDYAVSPLGELFYRTVWSKLSIEGCKVLDFGSGFGFTSSYLAEKNEVTAVEIDAKMIKASKKDEAVKQICGDISEVKKMPDESFDAVICHLVFEFVDEQKEILTELVRILKKGGIMSIVRHNRRGRIVQAVVQDYDLDDAKKLLAGGNSFSSAFGDIKYYENDDILKWSGNELKIENVYGVRALASLHNSETKSRENWLRDMLEIECELLKDDSFINIAFFNHVMLRRI